MNRLKKVHRTRPDPIRYKADPVNAKSPSTRHFQCFAGLESKIAKRVFKMLFSYDYSCNPYWLWKPQPHSEVCWFWLLVLIFLNIISPNFTVKILRSLLAALGRISHNLFAFKERISLLNNFSSPHSKMTKTSEVTSFELWSDNVFKLCPNQKCNSLRLIIIMFKHIQIIITFLLIMIACLIGWLPIWLW